MPYISMDGMVYGILTGTTSGTAGTETSHAHSGACAPRFYLIRPKSNGVVYESKPPDATNIYLKGSAASLAFEAVLFY